MESLLDGQRSQRILRHESCLPAKRAEWGQCHNIVCDEAGCQPRNQGENGNTHVLLHIPDLGAECYLNSNQKKKKKTLSHFPNNCFPHPHTELSINKPHKEEAAWHIKLHYFRVSTNNTITHTHTHCTKGLALFCSTWAHRRWFPRKACWKLRAKEWKQI